jgi:primase-polymerase (primpol)-like protein
MGYPADVTDPEHWSSFEFVLKVLGRRGFGDGIGFVFSIDDPYTGIDLDDVWQSDADEGATWATGILDRFSDTYSEISPSGRGVKIWCQAKAPRCGQWPIGGAGAIEVYDRRRFFTVTGCFAGIAAITYHQADVEALVANLDEGRQAVSRSEPIPDVIRKGQRHKSLVSIAGTMCRRGVCLEAINTALLEINHHQCSPPYPPGHIDQIMKSVQKWSK